MAKGLSEGLVDFTMKTGSGLIGLVAYPSQGVWRSLHTLLHQTARTRVEEAKKAEGKWLAAEIGVESLASKHIVRQFERL